MMSSDGVLVIYWWFIGGYISWFMIVFMVYWWLWMGFRKLEVPQNGWCIVNNPHLAMDDLGLPPILGNLQMSITLAPDSRWLGNSKKWLDVKCLQINVNYLFAGCYKSNLPCNFSFDWVVEIIVPISSKIKSNCQGSPRSLGSFFTKQSQQ